jgi:predicted dehydrogenase
MYRSHPLLARVLDVLRGGAIGAPLHLKSVFGFRTPREPGARLFNPELGGGSVLDVGCYPVSLARLVAGVPRGLPFAEPVRLSGGARVGPTGVDEFATLHLGFEAGFSAELASATRFELGTESVIFGEQGRLVIPNVWLPEGGRQGLTSGFSIHRDGREAEEVRVTAKLSTFALEAEVVADSLPRIEAPWPAMSHADSLGNARVLDAWLAQIQRSVRGL